MQLLPVSKPVPHCVWILAACSLPASGCVSGSLATDTGRSGEGAWSIAKVQKAHTGEEVAFSFILREPMQPQQRLELQGIADYVAVNILGERIEADAGREAKFELQHRFEGAQRGQTVEVRATAYKIMERRDYMKIRGQWQHLGAQIDQPDKKVAADGVRLKFYQSQVDCRFEKPMSELDWDDARLVITRSDGSSSTIFPDRPDRPGFSVIGPDDRGYYRIRYEPQAEQVNKTGTTRAVLYINDVDGRQHSQPFEFDTP